MEGLPFGLWSVLVAHIVGRQAEQVHDPAGGNNIKSCSSTSHEYPGDSSLFMTSFCELSNGRMKFTAHERRKRYISVSQGYVREIRDVIQGKPEAATTHLDSSLRS